MLYASPASSPRTSHRRRQLATARQNILHVASVTHASALRLARPSAQRRRPLRRHRRHVFRTHRHSPPPHPHLLLSQCRPPRNPFREPPSPREPPRIRPLPCPRQRTSAQTRASST